MSLNLTGHVYSVPTSRKHSRPFFFFFTGKIYKECFRHYRKKIIKTFYLNTILEGVVKLRYRLVKLEI